MIPRILFPFQVEVAQLDAVATRDIGGYDDDFKEVRVVSDPARTSEQQEQRSVFVPSQIEAPTWEALEQMAAGNVPQSKLTLVWSYRALLQLELVVPETGELKIRVNDRIISIRDKCLNLIQLIWTPPGLFITQVRPVFGMGQHRDLFLVSLDDREQGARP